MIHSASKTSSQKLGLLGCKPQCQESVVGGQEIQDERQKDPA